MDKDLEKKQSEALKHQGLAGIAKQNSESTNIEEVVAKEPLFTKEINNIVEILRGKNLEDISFIMRRVLEYAKTNAKL